MLHPMGVIEIGSTRHGTHLLITPNKLYVITTAIAYAFVAKITLARQIGPIKNLLFIKKI